MKKTAMQQMIDYLYSIGEYEIVDKAKKFLKEERTQIVEAYYQGGDDVCPNGKSGDSASYQYYVDTFSTNAS